MILCCGEALIDMLPRETTLGEPAFSPYAGGAVFNTAIALGRLGVPTAFFTGLADDMMGDILRDTLRKSNVDFSYCAIASRPSTIAFVKLVDGHATYAFYDEGTAGRMITEADLPAIGDECEALHFGAISLIPEPCGSTYEALMLREHEKRVISLDPNIRPGFIKDKAAHLARIRRMAAMSDIVKFSDEDAEGAVGYTADHKVTVPSERVTVVDTVGAGDTFDAGILASLKMQNLLTKAQVASLTEDQIARALALGAKAAAVTVSRAGANPPFANEIGL